jgi:hypothetical protein
MTDTGQPIRVKTTVRPATDTEEQKILVAAEGYATQVLTVDYSADNVSRAAVAKALGVDDAAITYRGDHARGYYYDVQKGQSK